MDIAERGRDIEQLLLGQPDLNTLLQRRWSLTNRKIHYFFFLPKKAFSMHGCEGAQLTYYL